MTDPRLPPDVHSPEYMPHGHAGASESHWRTRALAAERDLAEYKERAVAAERELALLQGQR